MQDTQPYRRAARAQARPLRRGRPRPVARRANWRRRLTVLGLLAVAVTVTGLVVLWQRAAAFNDAVSTQPAVSMRLFGPFSPDRVNVLLLGYSDESREGAFLTDSMNVVSIDRSTGTTTMIPIPRDLWVEGLPDVPQNLKINEAFRIGYYEAGVGHAGDLASAAVSHVTGLTIHGWISLDFAGFEAMVNSIGGIVIDNPVAFAYTWTEEELDAGSFQDSFHAGTLELDGRRALDYARNRYTSVPEESSDFARSIRQQRVLNAIRSELAGWEAMSKGLALADSLRDHMHTNVSVLDLALLVGDLSPDQRVELPEGIILEATTNTIGQYVLAIVGRSSADDYEPLHRFITQRLTAVPATSD